MGSGGSKQETRDFSCDSEKVKIEREPRKFKNLDHVRCIFFSQDGYKSNNHIPKSTLTLSFDSTIANLENDIEIKIKETYDKINNITKIKDGSDIKILAPIYVAFSRKLEYESNLFDEEGIKELDIDNGKDEPYKLAIGSYITSFLNKMNSTDLNSKYKSLPINSYGFKNGKIMVIMYFPFITSQYKYITNFKDIINSSSFFIKTITNTSFNGLPDVTTINEDKTKKMLGGNKELTTEDIEKLTYDLKNKDSENFRYSDDLNYLCNEGGCISDIGEDFNNLLPSLAANDSDNNNNAEKMAPFLPSKCLAQTVRYKCGVVEINNNKPIREIMKDSNIIDYLKETLEKYIINYNCMINKNQMDEKFCDEKADKNADLQQTPIDIISYAYSYQLRKNYTSDLNEDGKNYYSKDYNKNIIKELMLLRNKYPGIQEIVFPLYIYKAENPYLSNPPWGALFVTKDQIIDYDENIVIDRNIFSFNNKFYLKMDNNGLIYVTNYETKEIYYYLNATIYSNVLSFSIGNTITIFKYNKNGNIEQTPVLDRDIKIVLKDDIHREPFNFYINNEGRLRVFSNGFIDATDPNLIDLIEKKIIEFQKHGKSSNYLKLLKKNKLIDIEDEIQPLYIDK